MFVLNFIVGAGFFITSLVSTMIVGSLLGIPLRGTTEDIGTAASTMNPMLAFTTVLSFVITGLLVGVWAHGRVMIGKNVLGIENIGAEPKFETRKKLGLLVTIILLGIITSVIMVGFNGFISKFSPNADIANPITLWTALAQYDLLLLVSTILTMMGLGVIVTILGHLIHPIQNKVDKTPLS